MENSIRIEDLTLDYQSAVDDPDALERIKAGVKEWGFFVLTDYFSAQDCDELVAIVDDTIETRPEIVRSGGDKRIFCADALDPRIARFASEPLFEPVGTHVVGLQQKCIFPMVNRVQMVAGQARRSGGDWHRDRMEPQFKTLVYLTDVGPDNGPFCILPKSDMVWPFGKICKETGFDYFANRWDAETFAPFYEQVQDYLRIFTARRGTVVLFNSSTIHSGMPLVEGKRYAITNYFYSERDVNIKKMEKKFVGCARPITKPDYATAS